MEIILSKFCKSFTGTISRKHGYYIKCINGRFYGVRTSRAVVPPDGHWHFILCLAHMAVNSWNILVTDIRISSFELAEAFSEADYPPSIVTAWCVPGHACNAEEVIALEKKVEQLKPICNHESWKQNPTWWGAPSFEPSPWRRIPIRSLSNADSFLAYNKAQTHGRKERMAHACQRPFTARLCAPISSY